MLRVTFCFLVYYFLFLFEPIWLEKLKKKGFVTLQDMEVASSPRDTESKRKACRRGGLVGLNEKIL